MKEKIKTKKKNKLSNILIFLLIVLGSYYIGSTKYYEFQGESEAKCQANRKTIDGYVELYLIEKNVSGGSGVVMSDLVRTGYMKPSMKCFSGGEYSVMPRRISFKERFNNYVYCSVHKPSTIHDESICNMKKEMLKKYIELLISVNKDITEKNIRKDADLRRFNCPTKIKFRIKVNKDNIKIACPVHDKNIIEISIADVIKNKKPCYENMEIISRVFEMYKKNYNMRKVTIENLIEKKYLNEIPVCPDGGKYSKHNIPRIGFYIRCSKHGSNDSYYE